MGCDFYVIGEINATDAENNTVSLYWESKESCYYSDAYDENDYESYEEYREALHKYTENRCPEDKTLMKDGIWFEKNEKEQSDILNNIKENLLSFFFTEEQVKVKIAKIQNIERRYFVVPR